MGDDAGARRTSTRRAQADDRVRRSHRGRTTRPRVAPLLARARARAPAGARAGPLARSPRPGRGDLAPRRDTEHARTAGPHARQSSCGSILGPSRERPAHRQRALTVPRSASACSVTPALPGAASLRIGVARLRPVLQRCTRRNARLARSISGPGRAQVASAQWLATANRSRMVNGQSIARPRQLLCDHRSRSRRCRPGRPCWS